MKVEIISREIIKPSSPTPPHLRNYKLSLFDQINPRVFVPLLYFYLSDGNDDGLHAPCNMSERLSLLKKSLSQTLSHYYTISGRIKNNLSIDCNDEGVVVIEAQIKCELPEILKHPKNDILNLLFPDNLQWSDSDTGILLLVQITCFDCGGMAIGVCISHKTGDASSATNFIKDWAAMARGAREEMAPALLTTASTFPQGGFPNMPEAVVKTGKCVTQRLVFDASKIAILKAMAAQEVQNPTRVEVVTALIYRCAILASRSKLGFPNRAVLLQTVNLRKRVVPILPENLVGNVNWFFPVPTEMEDSDIALHSIVGQLRHQLLRFSETYAKNFRKEDWTLHFAACLEEARNLHSVTNQALYKFTSWCRFPLYEADFGWGKPIWVTIAENFFNNTIFLIDTREGDGVEVFVTLDEEDMPLFELVEDLLDYATFNPGVMEAEL